MNEEHAPEQEITLAGEIEHWLSITRRESGRENPNLFWTEANAALERAKSDTRMLEVHQNLSEEEQVKLLKAAFLVLEEYGLQRSRRAAAERLMATIETQAEKLATSLRQARELRGIIPSPLNNVAALLQATDPDNPDRSDLWSRRKDDLIGPKQATLAWKAFPDTCDVVRTIGKVSSDRKVKLHGPAEVATRTRKDHPVTDYLRALCNLLRDDPLAPAFTPSYRDSVTAIASVMLNKDVSADTVKKIFSQS